MFNQNIYWGNKISIKLSSNNPLWSYTLDTNSFIKKKLAAISSATAYKNYFLSSSAYVAKLNLLGGTIILRLLQCNFDKSKWYLKEINK